eukprot:TRINITY_DN2672_c0_g1_i1.p1 TRINITY_DN2672_c0_g1~~TRINITY_DN2672_c0_g1_i1.p1  ORF type:complete len:893 (+),score=212.81 TRINITY_DN2672_c0_g1_i1:286-2679(+)
MGCNASTQKATATKGEAGGALPTLLRGGTEDGCGTEYSDKLGAVGAFSKPNLLKNGVRRCAVGTWTEKKSWHEKTRALESTSIWKCEVERQLIATALRQNAQLTAVVPLDEDRVRRMVDVARKEAVPAGKEVITQGDLVAEHFYIVQQGYFTYFKRQETEEAASDSPVAAAARELRSPSKVPTPESSLKALSNQSSADNMASAYMSEAVEQVGSTGPGGSFGELALLFAAPRQATVRAEEPSVVWVINRSDFKNILMSAEYEQIDEYTNTLSALSLFKDVNSDNLRTIAESLVEVTCALGDQILTQGAHYILHDGLVGIYRSGVNVSTVTNPHYFGQGLGSGHASSDYSIVVASETAKLLVLDDATVGLIQKLISEMSPADLLKSRVAEAIRCKEVIYRNELARIGLLGCGAFGFVELCQRKDSKHTYAMKHLSKGFVVSQNLQKSVQNERDILFMLHSPFIVELYATYNGPKQLYLLMEAMRGGELHSTYMRLSFYGSVQHAQYYVAAVVLAFEHCHSRHVVYRDLKPENLLLNSKGHLKVTDMGLAKMVVGKTFTTCGTPQYMAPEIIQSSGHTKAVDWWTLGILLFELMAGEAPFEANSPMKIFAKVMKGIQKVQFPPHLSGGCDKLVKDLLKKKPDHRLPMKVNGMKQLRESVWYAGFDWDAMRQLKLTAPYIPLVQSETDISNFHAHASQKPKEFDYSGEFQEFFSEFATGAEEAPRRATSLVDRLMHDGPRLSFTNAGQQSGPGKCSAVSSVVRNAVLRAILSIGCSGDGARLLAPPAGEDEIVGATASRA